MLTFGQVHKAIHICRHSTATFYTAVNVNWFFSVFNVVCRKRLSSPRCRSELIDSASHRVRMRFKI